jgi:cardiolipin synthase
LVAVFLTLGHEGLIQTWLVIMVVFRDLMIVGGAILFHTVTQSLTMRPLMISKVNTFVQLVLALAVLFVEAYAVEDGFSIEVIGYIVAVTTLWSGTAYVITWSQRAAAMEPAVGNPGTGNPKEKK